MVWACWVRPGLWSRRGIPHTAAPLSYRENLRAALENSLRMGCQLLEWNTYQSWECCLPNFIALGNCGGVANLNQLIGRQSRESHQVTQWAFLSTPTSTMPSRCCLTTGVCSPGGEKDRQADNTKIRAQHHGRACQAMGALKKALGGREREAGL